MKVGLIVPGGVDRSGTHRVMPMILALLERIARAHEVHVFALFQEPKASTYELLGTTVHNIGKGQTAPRALARIIGEHGRGRFSLLHAIWASPSGALGAVASRLLRVPLLVHLLGGELVSMPEIGYGEARTRRGRRRVRFALRSAQRITAQSVPIAVLAEDAGFNAERLPLGFDRLRWPLIAPRARDASVPARLIHVASLNRVKDQETLLRAMALLRDDRVAFELDIVGEDTLDGAIQSMARELGLGERTRFHGFLEQSRLRPMLERADMLVMASRHEAGPAVLMEAALAGVPTVGTRVGQIAEWAPDAALAVPPGDAKAMASEIRALLDNDGRRIEIAAVAGHRASTEDADWTANRVGRIYQDMVRG
jgi:glycosyltransferase involved in cell wall biosynthesis